MASSLEANPKCKLLFEPEGGVEPWRKAWKRILSVSFYSNRKVGVAGGHGVKPRTNPKRKLLFELSLLA